MEGETYRNNANCFLQDSFLTQKNEFVVTCWT